MEMRHGPRVRRIMVAIDAANHSAGALELGAELAANLDIELVGLYVEDVNLIHLARLPTAREVHFISAISQLIDTPRMERSLKLHASRAREALQKASQRRGLNSTFLVARGHVAEMLVKEALDEDLLVLGIGRYGPSKISLTVARRTKRNVLLVRESAHMCTPVMVVYDGSPAALTALQVAAKLALSTKPRMIILMPRQARNHAQLQHEVRELLPADQLLITYRELSSPWLDSLINVLREEHGGLLVMPGDYAAKDERRFEALLNQIHCPLLLVK